MFDDNPDIYDDVLSASGLSSAPKPTKDPNISSLLDQVRAGASGQESGGRPNAVNSRTGALGEFQVLPANVPAWTRKHLRNADGSPRELTPEQFKADPQAQTDVFNGEFGEYLSDALKHSPDEDIAIRKAAAGWYGGKGAMDRFDDPTKFRPNEPSFREYTNKVLERTRAAKPISNDDMVNHILSKMDAPSSPIEDDVLHAAGLSEPSNDPPPNVSAERAAELLPAQVQDLEAAGNALKPPTLADGSPAPVPESSDTIQQQMMSALNPQQGERVAVLVSPDEAKGLGSALTSQFTPVKQPDGRILMVAKNGGSKFYGLNTAKDVQNYVKANGFAKLIGKVQDVGTTTDKGMAVQTVDKDGKELSTSVVTNPQAAQAQVASDAQQFPQGTSNVVPVQQAVAKRVAQTVPQGAEKMVDTPLPPMYAQAQTQTTSAAIAQPAQPVQVNAPQEATPDKYPDVTIHVAPQPGISAKDAYQMAAAQEIARTAKGVSYDDALEAVKADQSLNGADFEIGIKNGTALTIGGQIFRDAQHLAAQKNEAQKAQNNAYQESQGERGQENLDAFEKDLLSKSDAGIVSKDFADKELESYRQQKQKMMDEVQVSPDIGRGITLTDDEVQKKVADLQSEKQAELEQGISRYGSAQKFAQEYRTPSERNAEYLAHPNFAASDFIHAFGNLASSGARGISTAAEAFSAALGNKDADAKEGIGWKAADLIEKGLDEAFPQGSEQRQKASLGIIPKTLGTLAGYYALGPLGAIAAGTAGALGASASEYQQAVASNATPEERRWMALSGLGTGALMVIPAGRVLGALQGAERATFLSKFLNSAFGQVAEKEGAETALTTTKQLLKTLAADATTASGTMLGAKKLNDLAASLTYDKDRKVLNLSQDDLNTALEGAIFGTAGAVIGHGAGHEAPETQNPDTSPNAELPAESPEGKAVEPNVKEAPEADISEPVSKVKAPKAEIPDALKTDAEQKVDTPKTYSRDTLKKAFNLTDEQAEATDTLAKSMGIDLSSLSVEKGGTAGTGALEQTAWHGSPHVFDKFSTDKIGTGEGAQAYGHGLYFTDKEDIANHYREALADVTHHYVVDGKDVDLNKLRYDDQLALRIATRPDVYTLENAVHGDYPQSEIPYLKKRIQEYKDSGASFQENKSGAKYKVELKPDEDSYLLWDKPLSEQSEKVKGILKEAGLRKEHRDFLSDPRQKISSKGQNGQHLYHMLEDARAGQKAASDYLHSLGIRGIKYLAGDSRSKGEGNYNYVIFNDKDVDITDVFRQGAKGATEFAKNGKATIRGFQSADVSTGVHELAHVARRQLFNTDLPAEKRAGITDQDIRVAEIWSGAKKGEWTRNAEEKFARGFERYLRDGKSPHPKLDAVFAKFKNWLTGIYAKLKGSDINVKIAPEMKNVFDNLVTRSDVKTEPTNKENLSVQKEQPNETISTVEAPPAKVAEKPTATEPVEPAANVEAKKPNERSLPKTMEAGGLEKGTNLTYDPEKISSGIDRGREIVKEKGVDAAMEFVRHSNGIEWAPTGYAALEHLRKQEAEMRQTDPAKADEIQKKRTDFLDEFAEEATKRGQSIVGVKAIEEFAPDRAAYLLNKASQRVRGRKISDAEDKRITDLGTQLEAERNRSKNLEEQVAQAEKQAAGKAKPSKPKTYQDALEKSAEDVKAQILSRKIDLSAMAKRRSMESQKGAIGESRALPGDAELVAQYAAGQLHKIDTVDALNKDLVNTFGKDVEPHLSDIRKRAYQIRQDARLAELAKGDTSKAQRRTIIQDIRKEISDADVAEKSRQVEADKKQKQLLTDATKAQKADARESAKKALIEQRAKDTAAAKEAKAQAKAYQKSLIDARKAETKGYRESFKNQKQAEKEANFWDKGLRQISSEAKARLATADSTSPDVINDLASVGAEKFLRDDKGGVPGKRTISPAQFYREMQAEYPDLVTNKNKGQIFKQAYQSVQDAVAAGRYVTDVTSANKVVQNVWKEQGVDTNTQAILIQKAANARRQHEIRSEMAQEFTRVNQPLYKRIGKEVLNAPRALQTTLNMHQGRQGLFTLMTHPSIAFGTSIPQTLRGFRASAPDFVRLTEQLKQDPMFPLAEQSGLNIAELPRASTDLKGHIEEDQLQSSITMKLPWVRKSTQGFVLGMNSERLGLFKKWAAIGEANGYTFENNPKFFQDAASVANDFTGRGAAPEMIEKTIGKMNQLLYAPRLKVSQVKAVNDLFNPFNYFGKNAYDPVMKKIMIQNAVKATVGFAATYATLVAMGGKGTDDPDDPDFGKIVFGHTHYDLTGGAGATFKTAYKLITSIYGSLSGAKQDEYEKPLAIAEGFVRKKLAPWPAAVIDFFSGKNAVGQPANVQVDAHDIPKTMKENIALRMVLPLVVNEITEGVADGGLMGLAKSGPASLMGVSEQTYTPKEYKDKESIGNQVRDGKLTPDEAKARVQWQKDEGKITNKAAKARDKDIARSAMTAGIFKQHAVTDDNFDNIETAMKNVPSDSKAVMLQMYLKKAANLQKDQSPKSQGNALRLRNLIKKYLQ